MLRSYGPARPSIGYTFSKGRPAAAVPAGGWTVNKFTRKSGNAAGKEYSVYVGPTGIKYSSLKKARVAGYVEP